MKKKENFWQRIYKKNPNFVARKIEDEIILVPIKRNSADLEAIYNLNNEVSVKIWELINGKRSLKEIEGRMLEEFRVGREKLEKDMREFIRDLEKIEAIK
jgi:hypothetical protein